MRIFLTGGTGFIGQYLTQALLRRGWEVSALVRNPQSGEARVLQKLGATLVQGDVTDRESMRAGMTGADIVIHNAGHYEFGVDAAGQRRMHAVNVTGTENVLGLALELGVPRSVYVSSTMYYGETGPEACDESYRRQKPYRSYYEQTKTEAHTIALQYQQRGLPLVIVCPNGVTGPNDHVAAGYFLRMYLNRLMPPYAWAPDIVTSFVHVNDAAEGIALTAEKGRFGETYLLAGEPHRRRDMARYWNARPGGFKISFFIPNWLAWVMFAPLEPLQRLAGLPAFISREMVTASVSLNYSSAKAQRELGWTHRSAEAMWADTIDGEIKLLAQRTKRDLVSRLKPVPADK